MNDGLANKEGIIKLANEEYNERNLMIERLQESGDLDRMKKHAYAKLMLNGWKDEIKTHTRDAIERSGNIEELTLDELNKDLEEHSIQSIPVSIKEELSLNIREACGYDTLQQQQQQQHSQCQGN